MSARHKARLPWGSAVQTQKPFILGNQIKLPDWVIQPQALVMERVHECNANYELNPFAGFQQLHREVDP